MAGVSVVKKRADSSGSQGEWATPSGWAYVSRYGGSVGNRRYGSVWYQISVDYSGASELTEISFDLALKCTEINGVDISAVLCSYATTSTSIASKVVDAISGPTGSYFRVSFSGLHVTNQTLYLYVQASNPASLYADYYVAGDSSGSTPSCSASFTYPSISMTLSSSSVSTGSNQIATFTNGSGRSVSVAVKYNNTTLWSGSTTNGSLTIPVQKSWFSSAGITTYREFSVSIQATESYSGTIYDSFYIVAGSDMNPTVGTPTVSIVQASGKPTTNYPNTYLANISKAKVTASVSSGSNASIASVVLTYTGGSAINMTYNSSTGKYEATTPELVSASTSFTVTAKDGRRYNRSGTDVGGMSAAATTSAVSVVQYSPPSLSVDTGATFRCTQGGNQDSGGAYFRAKAAASYYSALSGNSLLEFSVKIQGAQTAYPLTSGVQTGALDGTLVATTNYTLEFVIEDKVSAAVTKTFPLGSQVRDIVAIHNSTGTALGVGTTPQRQAGSSVELPMGGDFLAGGFPWGSLTVLNGTTTDGSGFGKDFLNVEFSTRYAAKNATVAFDQPASDSGWSNIPSSKVGVAFGGIREVLWVSGSCIMVKLTEFYPYSGVIWTNYYNGSAWAGWRYNS